jgi:PhzF family phenazine biosynthesis protein
MRAARPLQVVDAFTTAAFRGNPAAVVLLEAAADDAWQQSVAAEMKHAETAFLVPRDDGAFDLRWFTPAAEVDLCGHATLASAHALWDWGTLERATPARFHTRSGMLTCAARDALIEMDFPATPALPADEVPGLFDALGVRAPETYRSDFYALVELASADAVRAVAPDMGKLVSVDLRAVIVTAVDDGDDHDVISRMFAPRMGIPEDPVTGSAHCVLAPHYAPRLGPELRAYQASARGGVVRTRLDGDRVALGGEAVTVVRGELVA